MKQLDDILAYCDAATEGPWELECYGFDVLGKDDKRVCFRGYLEEDHGVITAEESNNNMDFICNSRTDLPKVTRALKKAKKALEECDCDCGGETGSDSSYMPFMCIPCKGLMDIQKELESDEWVSSKESGFYDSQAADKDAEVTISAKELKRLRDRIKELEEG